MSNNLFYEDGASAAGTGISLVSSTNNAIGQNSLYGKWNVGLSLDSASSGNTALDTNTCSTTTVTCLSETIGNNPLVTNEMKFGTGGVIINLGGGYGMTAYNGATADTAATGVEGGVGDPTLYFNILSTGNYAFRTGGTITATIDDAGNMHAGNGANIVYRCATAGTLPAGALTITSGDCGTTTDTGLRVK